MTTLYLVPSLLSENTLHSVIPQNVLTVVHGLQQFVVEDFRTARRFLSKTKHPQKIENIQLYELNEHTPESEISKLLPIIRSADAGLLSEAGIPAVADPGSNLVRLAHENNIKVVPLVGPSSILMAIMASGLNGQSFAFVGYLPVKNKERQERIKALERRSAEERQTQIFIETPYRNIQLLKDILSSCRSSTLLTVAADVTGTGEFIKTQTIKKWKNKLPEINKVPSVFLIQA